MAFDTAANSMFFLPWQPPSNDGASAPASDATSDLIPPSKNWARGFFSTNNSTAPYYIARAHQERAVVIGCSGLNTHNILSPEDVKKLNKAGISIIWMALPKIPHGKPLMETYLPLAREFFTNKESPARLLMSRDVPRYALTHSTGAQIFLHLLHDPDSNKKLSYIFSGAVHVAPYFDTSHASRDHTHRLIQATFKRYMAHQSDVSPNERLIGKSYVLWNDFKDSSGNTLPRAWQFAKDILRLSKIERHDGIASTCGQILELQDWGQRLTARSSFNAEACRKIPSIFVIGDKDNFACPKTAIDIANRIGAEIEIAEGGLHDPLRTHPHLLDKFVQKVQECATRYETQKAQTVYVSDMPAKQDFEPIPYGLFDKLRDRARLTLQSGASSLNPMTRFF